MIQGFPISASLPEDLGFGERFWYWRGASGRAYIHSIYPANSYPPLAGAVFVFVEKSGGGRRPVAVGRFPEFDSRTLGCREIQVQGPDGSNEIHVHLLTRDAVSAEAVQRDLEDALNRVPMAQDVPGLAESAQLSLLPI